MLYTNTKRSITTKSFLALIITLLITSCISFDDVSNRIQEEVNDMSLDESVKVRQEAIVKNAILSTQMAYNETITFNNRTYNNDCSGLIYGIYWAAGIDLLSAIANETGNGVKRLYTILDRKDLIHTRKLPNPGDIIFWNNTYGAWGTKPLSHAGIVVSVDKETGQIDYIHNNTYIGAVRRETMNLYKPHEKKPINHYMRYDRWHKKTAGELFDSFGMAWKL